MAEGPGIGSEVAKATVTTAVEGTRAAGSAAGEGAITTTTKLGAEAGKTGVENTTSVGGAALESGLTGFNTKAEMGATADQITSMSSDDIHASLENFVGPTVPPNAEQPGGQDQGPNLNGTPLGAEQPSLRQQPDAIFDDKTLSTEARDFKLKELTANEGKTGPQTEQAAPHTESQPQAQEGQAPVSEPAVEDKAPQQDSGSTSTTTPEQPSVPVQNEQTAHVKQDWENWQNQAQFHEPTAEERAKGQQVELKKPADSETDKPINTTEASTPQPEDKADGQDPNSEVKKTPEQMKAEQSMRRDEAVAKLKELNPKIDLKDQKIQELLNEAQDDPEKMDTLEQTLEAVSPKKEDVEARAEQTGLTEEKVADMLKNGEIKNLLELVNEGMKKAGEPKSEEEKKWFDKLKWWQKLLLILAAASVVAPIAATGAGMAAMSNGAKK